MNGIFAEYQPKYAEYGIPTFPLIDKKPCVAHYNKTGMQASAKNALKFGDAPQIGCMVRSAKLTIVDIDTPDQNVLNRAISDFGPTPVIVRSGSGNHQLWYRHNGESRHIRKMGSQPIDILGDGLVVLPPSLGRVGHYDFIQGNLPDLDKLPKICAAAHSKIMQIGQKEPAKNLQRERDISENAVVSKGERNSHIFKRAMQTARGKTSIAEILNEVLNINKLECSPPLLENELEKIVKSAWDYEQRGENRFGREARMDFSPLVYDLLFPYPDAWSLLSHLKRHHTLDHKFVVANAMALSMPGGGWTRKRLAMARKILIEKEIIIELTPATQQKPANYEFSI